MTMADPSRSAALTRPLGRGALSRPSFWLMIFSGAFVFIEPAPYELAFLVLCWALLIERLHIPSFLVAPVALLLLVNLGGFMSLLLVPHDLDAVIYVLVTLYLSVTVIVLAAYIAEDPQDRLPILRSAYIAGALCAALAGIAGYFTGSELLTLYGRASGTFKDPNVFGPFLILPALLLLQDILAFDIRKFVRAALPLALLLAAIALSFSRGAWIHLILSGALMIYLLLVTSPQPVVRLRIVLGMSLAALSLAVLITVLISIPQVRDLLSERAGLQYYDVGETGRFGKHQQSIPSLLERPLGYGPLQFGPVYREDPHNVYINAFSSYGWLGGAGYLAFVVATLAVGLRQCFVQAPWRPFLIATFATFAGVAGEGVIIDTDHWRHFFLLAAIIWGLASVNRSRSSLAADTRTNLQNSPPIRPASIRINNGRSGQI